MIEIKMRKFIPDESWVENLEKYLPKSSFGALKYVLETELASPIAPSVSLYFYDVDNVINTLIGSGLITYKYELVIIKNGIRLFGGFLDPKSVNRISRERIISFTILSYRYALKFENGEEVYDRYYEDSTSGSTKVWYNFKATNELVNNIYDRLNSNDPSIVIDKFIDYYHLLDSSGKKFLSFRDKNELLNLPSPTNIYGILNDPSNKDIFAIFYDDGYYRGNFDIGFKRVINPWHDERAVEPANWINQDLDSTAKIHARHQLSRISGYGNDMNYWDVSDVAYATGRELCLGVRVENSEEENYAKDVVIGRRLYSGSSWGAWGYSVLFSGYSRAIILPFKCTNVDSRTGKWYSIFRDTDGWVWVERFNNNTTWEQSFISNTRLFRNYIPYEEVRLVSNTAKLINEGNNSKLFMLQTTTQELVVFNPSTGHFAYHDLELILGSGIYWNLESLTYNRDTDEYFSWMLEADGTLAMYKGLPYLDNFERISGIYKFALGPSRADNPDNWNPVEILFKNYITDSPNTSSPNGGFYGLDNLLMANTPNGNVLSSVFFNEFGNYCQFVTYSLTGDIIIAEGDFTDKTYSSIIKDLALNTRSVEYINQDQKMFFFDRKRAIPKIYELRTAADSIVCNVAYILYTEKLDLDPGNGSYTVECLCSLYRDTATDSVLIHDGSDTGVDDCWMIYADSSGIIKAKLCDSTITINLNSQEVIYFELGKYYIVLEIDRDLNLAKLYVNGILKDSQDITALGTINSTTHLCIGRYKWTGAIEKPWNGNIREVRITKRALREEIITQNLEFNGWETDRLTVGHWNFNDQNTRDLSSKKNFLTIRQHGSGYLTIYIQNELLKLSDITAYLSDEIRYIVWENYFDGIKVSYADGDLEVGQTDPGKSILNISVNYIYVESQARIIAESYYNFFNTKRNKLECKFVNYYPILYKHYIVNAKQCVCIDTIHYNDSDTSTASFVEVT